jgi:hypothetical protein
MKRTIGTALMIVVMACLWAPAAQAVIWNVYFDRATFLTALGAPPFATQDFSGYADNAPMSGVSFLPGGVNVTTNADGLIIWPSGKELFALDDHTRIAGNLYYDIHVNNYYSAFGFDIMAYNPAEGAGWMDVWFSEGTNIFGPVGPAGPTENDPTFFGVIANTTISGIRWSEGLEIGGGNEETTLDNFVAANPVPEPGTILLLGTGLAGLGAAYRRRRRS